MVKKSAFPTKNSLFGPAPPVPALMLGAQAPMRRLANSATAEANLNKRRLGPLKPFKHRVGVAMRREAGVKKMSAINEVRRSLAGIGRALTGVARNTFGLGNPRVRKMKAKRKAMVMAVNRTMKNAKKAREATATAERARLNALRANEQAVGAARALQNMTRRR